MCGILGGITRRDANNKYTSDSIADLLPFIGRRGPDARGVRKFHFSGFSATLAHTRLAIIDVSERGDQPMEDEASGWWITYNGEIYNYLEVREELCALGWSFHGASDTEVVLKSWVQWGPEALHRFNGMFAFAIVNCISGDTWLVRDRFGIKPLLWGRLPDGGLVFSSSVAAVGTLIGADIDTSYCAHALRYKAFEVPGTESPFRSMQAVPAGGWLKVEIATGGLKMTEGRWYDLKTAVARKTVDILEYADDDLLTQCSALLDDAVRIRLRSDVPVAVSLSGGLDSSTIAAIASRHVTGLHGFSYGFPDAQQSEGPVVAMFAHQMRIKAEYVWPQYDAVGLDGLLERGLRCQEAPFPGLSVLAQNEVFRIVRQAGFKVLLGGQGGDEIFAGYRKFFVVAARDAINRRDAVGAIRLLYSLGLMLFHEVGKASLYWQVLSRYRRKTEFEFSLLDWHAPSANLWGSIGGGLADRQLEDIQKWSIPSLLRYEDRNSMGHGVETRLPFMDYRLVELALALPARLKIARGYGKWALRKITAGVVPNMIRLNHQKRGFDVTQSWIEGGIGASLRERIQSNMSTLSPYMKKNTNYMALLTDEALKNRLNLLDEALMLAWLAEPIRSPIVSGSEI